MSLWIGMELFCGLLTIGCSFPTKRWEWGGEQGRRCYHDCRNEWRKECEVEQRRCETWRSACEEQAQQQQDEAEQEEEDPGNWRFWVGALTAGSGDEGEIDCTDVPDDCGSCRVEDCFTNCPDLVMTTVPHKGYTLWEAGPAGGATEHRQPGLLP